MVQHVANIWPIDNQNYFLTFEHNYHRKLLPEIGWNWVFQENQHFYLVEFCKQTWKKKSKFTHRQKEASKFACVLIEGLTRLKKSWIWAALSGTETTGHEI